MAADPKPMPETWPENVTLQDVLHFALPCLVLFIARFNVGYMQKDNAGMIEAIKGIRNIARRMDQFRRDRAKQWAAAAPAQTHKEKTD